MMMVRAVAIHRWMYDHTKLHGFGLEPHCWWVWWVWPAVRALTLLVGVGSPTQLICAVHLAEENRRMSIRNGASLAPFYSGFATFVAILFFNFIYTYVSKYLYPHTEIVTGVARTLIIVQYDLSILHRAQWLWYQRGKIDGENENKIIASLPFFFFFFFPLYKCMALPPYTLVCLL